MELRHRLIKGSALNLIAVVFNQGSTLVANILVARILMQQNFGEYAMVQTTLLTMSTLSQLATGYTASKYIAEYRSSDTDRTGRIMGICLLVSSIMAVVGTVVLISISQWLSKIMLNAPQLTLALILGSGFLFFSSINGYQTGVLSGLEAFGSLAKAGVASGLVTIIAISLGAWLGELNGAIIGLSISAFIRCVIHYKYLLHECQLHAITPQYKGSLKQEKEVILKFALPAALAGYYSMPMFWLANSFLVRQPGGYSEMALYAAAVNLKGFALYAPAILNSVISSILNHMKGIGSLKHYNRFYKFNVVLTFFITMIIALVIGIFGDLFLGMFGKSFVAAKTILLIILVSSILETTGGAIHQYIQNHGKMWFSFLFINFPVVFIFVVVAYFIIPKLGALGLGIANLIMTTFQLFLTGLLTYYINRRAKILIL